MSVTLSDLSTASTAKLLKLRNKLNRLYHEGKSPVTDEDYDAIVDELSSRQVEAPIGLAQSISKNKRRLPYHMGSANKVTPETATRLQQWLDKWGPDVMVSDKLDGVSGLYDKGRLYTRGDGTTGTDITTCDLPINLPEDVIVRGEFIVSKRDFANTYASEFKNGRNMVAGLINGCRSVPELQFVIYELIGINNPATATIKAQYSVLKHLKIPVVHHQIVKNATLHKVMNLLKKRRVTSEFEIDGLVLHTLKPYTRNLSGNPEYLIAFKMQGDSATAKVLSVEWNISKTGLYKPTVLIEPVSLDGVTIRRVYGHNAQYIVTEGIDTGAIVTVTRANQVIPYILNVVKRVIAQPPEGTWTSSGVDLMADKNSISQQISQMQHMLSVLGVPNTGRQMATKLVTNGYPTFLDVLESSPFQMTFLTLQTATRLYEHMIQAVKTMRLSKILAGSGILGPGLGPSKIDELIVSNKLPNTREFKKFMKRLLPFRSTEKDRDDNTDDTDDTDDAISTKYQNVVAVFSGFRDPALAAEIESGGGMVVNSVSRKVTVLLVKSLSSDSLKIDKARSLGIPIRLAESFVSEHNP